jgi:putative transposase
MLRAYKFRVYPSREQITRFEKTLRSCCFLYNSALQERKYAQEFHKRLNYYDQQAELPGLKKALPEYRRIYSQVLQDVLRRLEKAFEGFFNGRGHPRFKPAWRYNSFTYPQKGFKILPNGHVEFSKLGKLRMFVHRKILGKIKTLTIKRDRVGDWFVIITAESPDIKPREIKSVITIDVGLEKLLMLSSGEYVEPPQFSKRSEKHLARLQRLLSLKKPGSKNREKARTRIAKLHRKIERQRSDFLHKLSRKLVDRTDLLVFEKLQIHNMVKNHHLSKSIYDASWGRLIQFCSYKASTAGKKVELIDPRGTTQRCSGCGTVVEKSLSQRVHRCPTCGLLLDRDLNTTFNMLEQIGRGTPESTPVEMRPLLVGTPACRVREAGNP